MSIRPSPVGTYHRSARTSSLLFLPSCLLVPLLSSTCFDYITADISQDTLMTPLFLFIIAAALLLVWAVILYNRFVTLRNQVMNGWKQIDVQLKRRHDLIPNLVSTVKGYMEFEQDTLLKVISARNAAAAAKTVTESAEKETALTSALGKFFALAENYPNLKANENVRQLQEELSSTENKIGFARQFYNDIATKFNIALQVFPGNLIAGMFGFQPADLFEVQDAAERQVPNVDLSLK
jgi:LemA protein